VLLLSTVVEESKWLTVVDGKSGDHCGCHWSVFLFILNILDSLNMTTCIVLFIITGITNNDNNNSVILVITACVSNALSANNRSLSWLSSSILCAAMLRLAFNWSATPS
jgi:hypothetical protein